LSPAPPMGVTHSLVPSGASEATAAPSALGRIPLAGARLQVAEERAVAQVAVVLAVAVRSARRGVGAGGAHARLAGVSDRRDLAVVARRAVDGVGGRARDRLGVARRGFARVGAGGADDHRGRVDLARPRELPLVAKVLSQTGVGWVEAGAGSGQIHHLFKSMESLETIAATAGRRSTAAARRQCRNRAQSATAGLCHSAVSTREECEAPAADRPSVDRPSRPAPLPAATTRSGTEHADRRKLG